MKQKITIIILSALLVILIAVSVIAYNSFSENYEETTATTTAATPDETKNTVQTLDFAVTDKDGNTVALSDFFGKPIVVNFWATWCSPCTTEMPHFEALYKEFGEDVQFLMVNVGDSRSEALAFAEKNGYTFPVYHDSFYSATQAYSVSSIPGTLFINADGWLVHSQIGMMSEAAIRSNIEKIK